MEELFDLFKFPRIIALVAALAMLLLSTACASPTASHSAASAAGGGRISLGNPAAPVTIVEFTDFQCPYCSKGAQTLKLLMTKYDGKVRLIVRHFPLQSHPDAMPAALYFEAIALQSSEKAWTFYDSIFADQQKLSGGEEYLKKVAGGLGVDMNLLAKDLGSEQIKARIASDMKEFEMSSFDGVPVFVINGTVLVGAQPIEIFTEVIEAALK